MKAKFLLLLFTFLLSCNSEKNIQPNVVLIYLDDFDCVFGTRTSKSMIGLGAKMTPYLRYGNILVAKFLEYLFSGPSLTDVGCSYKAFKKETKNDIINSLSVKSSHFQPELMIKLI